MSVLNNFVSSAVSWLGLRPQEKIEKSGAMPFFAPPDEICTDPQKLSDIATTSMNQALAGSFPQVTCRQGELESKNGKFHFRYYDYGQDEWLTVVFASHKSLMSWLGEKQSELGADVWEILDSQTGEHKAPLLLVSKALVYGAQAWGYENRTERTLFDGLHEKVIILATPHGRQVVFAQIEEGWKTVPFGQLHSLYTQALPASRQNEEEATKFSYAKAFGVVVFFALTSRSQVSHSFGGEWNTMAKTGFAVGAANIFGPSGGAAFVLSQLFQGSLCNTPPQITGTCPEVFEGNYGDEESRVQCLVPPGQFTLEPDLHYEMGGFQELSSDLEGDIIGYEFPTSPSFAQVDQRTLFFKKTLIENPSITCIPQTNTSLLVTYSGSTLQIWSMDSSKNPTLLNTTTLSYPIVKGMILGQTTVGPTAFLQTSQGTIIEILGLGNPSSPTLFRPIDINNEIGNNPTLVDFTLSKLYGSVDFLWAVSQNSIVGYAIGNPSSFTSSFPISFADGIAKSPVTATTTNLLLVPKVTNVMPPSVRVDFYDLLPTYPQLVKSLPASNSCHDILIIDGSQILVSESSQLSLWNIAGTPQLLQNFPLPSGVNVSSLHTFGNQAFGLFSNTNSQGVVTFKIPNGSPPSFEFVPTSYVSSFQIGRNDFIQCGQNVSLNTVGGVMIKLQPESSDAGIHPLVFKVSDYQGVGGNRTFYLSVVNKTLSTLTTNFILPPGNKDSNFALLALLALPFLALSVFPPIAFLILALGRSRAFRDKIAGKSSIKLKEEFVVSSETKQLPCPVSGTSGQFAILQLTDPEIRAKIEGLNQVQLKENGVLVTNSKKQLVWDMASSKFQIVKTMS